MKKKKAIEQNLDYEVGNNNIFADLELENPGDELLKSDLTAEIYSLIKKKKLTQDQAAKILGVDQPWVSSLLRGRFDLFSIEMLMHFLTDLGQDIQIVVKPKPRNRKKAHLSVCTPSSVSGNIIPMAAKSH